MGRSSAFLIGLAILLVAVFAFISYEHSTSTAYSAEMYHSPTCECCERYEEYLESHGIKVKSIEVSDVESIKRKLNIPSSMWSCHTLIIEGYYVEGHVPIEVIQKLLSERPDVEGIALPGMPQGAPGMEGEQVGELVVYCIANGEIMEYMRISGTTSPGG